MACIVADFALDNPAQWIARWMDGMPAFKAASHVEKLDLRLRKARVELEREVA